MSQVRVVITVDKNLQFRVVSTVVKKNQYRVLVQW